MEKPPPVTVTLSWDGPKYSYTHCYFTFVNQTQRFADIMWVDFQGSLVIYGVLAPGQSLDVNTEDSYTWSCRDSNSRARLMVQQGEVYQASPWQPEDGWPPNRRQVHITIPVFSLQERCIQVICQKLRPGSAEKLPLPNPLLRKVQAALQAQTPLQPWPLWPRFQRLTRRIVLDFSDPP